MPTEFYRLHGGRLSLAEYWRMSPNAVTFLVAAAAKPFGGLPIRVTAPRLDALRVVDWNALPPAARDGLRGPVERFQDAGFAYQFCHDVPALEANRLGAAADLLGPDGVTAGSAMYVRVGAVVTVEVACVTWFDDDTVGSTTSARLQLTPRPGSLAHRYPGTPADRIAELHREHLREWEAEGKRPRRLTAESLGQLLLEESQRWVDFQAGRGVLVRMTDAEVQAAGG